MLLFNDSQIYKHDQNDRAMRKRVFRYMRTVKAQISLRKVQADQGVHCPLTESLDTTECKNGE